MEFLYGIAIIIILKLIFGGIKLLVSFKVKKAIENQGVAIPDLLKNNPKEEFYLYLRPFVLDEKALTSMQYPKVISTGIEVFETVEIAVSLKVRLYFPLDIPFLALGNKGSVDFFTNIPINRKNWKNDFKRLAQNSDLILIIPSFTKSSIWEIKWLQKNRLMYKCMFIMPPEYNNNNLSVEAFWKKAKKMLVAKGIIIPPYSKFGSFFLMNSRGIFYAKNSIDISPLFILDQVKIENAEMKPLVENFVKNNYKKIPMTKSVNCLNCSSELELSDSERTKKLYKCPICFQFSLHISLFDNRYAEPGSRLLAKEIPCPKCDSTLELDDEEREKWEVICPSCRNHISFYSYKDCLRE